MLQEKLEEYPKTVLFSGGIHIFWLLSMLLYTNVSRILRWPHDPRPGVHAFI